MSSLRDWQERKPEPLGHWAARWWTPVALWLLVGATLFALQAYASKSPNLLDGWNQFDGPEYVSVFRNGYQSQQLVWFPALPLLVRIGVILFTDPVVAAVVVSGLGGLAASVLFWFWTGVQSLDRCAQLTGLLVLLLYPYAWFLYGVIYPDALFVAFALGSFVLLHRGHPWLCAVVGSLATAARPSGFAVVIGLVVLSFERAGFIQVPSRGQQWIRDLRLPFALDFSRWSPRLLVPSLSSAGLLGYMLYQWVEWGSPVRFVTEQEEYHEPGSASLLKEQFFAAFGQGFDGRHLATTAAQAVILIVVLASVPAVGRRFGWGYGVYVAGLVALPLVSVSTFMGVGRYMLPAFPCFALFGEWLTRRRLVAAVWFPLATVALAVMTFGFARSWYLT